MNTNSNEDREKENNLNIFSKKSLNKKGFSFTKIKGSTSFVERLKNVSKRDIAYFIVGVSILILAPVAEYFLSKPNANTALTPGFGERRSSESAGIYEPGVNALSAGSPDGMEEVVAPLTARDPSSLILGAQEEPSPQIPMPPPTETKRDSIADIAKKSFSEATKSSPAPFIPPKMNASLRGASSFFGGDEGTKTSGVLSSGNILANAKNAPSQAQKKSMLGPQAIPGYKGVASQSDSVNKGAFEKLRNQADKAAGYFSGANASESLEKAGAASINPASDGGFGALQDGGRNTNPSGSSTRGSFSFSPGDPCRGSIERELACENARKANDFKNFLKYDLKKKIIESAVDNIIGKGLLEPIGKTVADANLLNPAPPSVSPFYCVPIKNQSASNPCDKYDFNAAKPAYSSKDKDQQVTWNCGELSEMLHSSTLNYWKDQCKNGSAGNGGGQQPVQPGGGSVTPVVSSEIPQEIKEAVINYDVNLKEAIRTVNLAKEAKTIDDFQKYQLPTKCVESTRQTLSYAQQIVSINTKMIDKNFSELTTGYYSSIKNSQKTLENITNTYSTLISNCDNLISRLQNLENNVVSQLKKQKSGAITESGEDPRVIRYKNEIESMITGVRQEKSTYTSKKDKLGEDEKLLQSHENASKWYNEQFSSLRKLNESIDSFSGTETGKINHLDLSLNPTSIKNLFYAIAGVEIANLNLPTNSTSSLEKDVYRMAVGDDNQTNTIDLLILWRTADRKKAEAQAQSIDDEEKIHSEIMDFNKLKPSLKFMLNSGEHPYTFENFPLNENSFVLSAIRNVNVYEDLKVVKNLMVSLSNDLKDKNAKADEDKKENSKNVKEIENKIKEILDSLNPAQPSHPPSSPGNQPITIVNNVIVGAANSNSNSSASANSISNTEVKPTQQPPAPQPSHPASPQPNSQEVLKYQIHFDTLVNNIKELKSKKSSLRSENNIAYESLLKCLNSVAIYLPGGCGKKEKAFNDANSRYLNAIQEVRQAKENCREYYNSIPDKIRKQIVGECN